MLLLITVNEKYGVEVDCSSVSFKMEGSTDTNTEGIFFLYGIFYLTFVPYRKCSFTTGYSKTSIHMYQTTRRHMPQDIFTVSALTNHISTYQGINSTMYLVVVWYVRIMKQTSCDFVCTSSHGV